MSEFLTHDTYHTPLECDGHRQYPGSNVSCRMAIGFFVGGRSCFWFDDPLLTSSPRPSPPSRFLCFMIDIGRRLHWARTSAGLSQKDLAASVGCTSKTIRRYEKSITRPDTRMLYRLATATGTSIETLIGAGERSADASPASRISEGDGAGGTRIARNAIAHRSMPPESAARVPVQVATIDGPRHHAHEPARAGPALGCGEDRSLSVFAARHADPDSSSPASVDTVSSVDASN